MRKNLLIALLLLVMAGMVKAQDVYLLGTKNYYYEFNTVYMPTIWKNGEILYQDGEPLEGYSFEKGGLAIDDETQDVYWYSARSYNNTFERACIYKNDQVVYNINVVGNIAPRIINMQLKKFAGTNTMALYSAGYKLSGGNWNAVIWREGNELFVPTAGSGVSSYAFDIAVVGDDESNCEYYYCGDKETDNNSHAIVWHNNGQSWFNETVSYTENIAVYNGDIYVFGSEFDNVTWITTSYVWKNGEVFMTFEEPDASVQPQCMVISDGDLWLSTTTRHESDAKGGDGKLKIWKNGAVMYEHDQSEYEDSYVSGMDVVNGDVYYIIQAWNDPTCDVYKNGELLYGFNGDDININALKVYYHDTTSVQETEATTLSVYPNPASDIIRIENGSDETVEIYNATGQLVMSVEANDGNISVSGLPSGLYLLKQGGNTTQFIKE